MAIESKATTVDGSALRALVQLATAISGEEDGDPRPALIGAVAVVSLIAADIEITGESVARLATAISKVAAEEAEKLLPKDTTSPVDAVA